MAEQSAGVTGEAYEQLRGIELLPQRERESSRRNGAGAVVDDEKAGEV